MCIRDRHGTVRLGASENDAARHGMRADVTQETLEYIPFVRAVLGSAHAHAPARMPWVKPRLEASPLAPYLLPKKKAD